MGSFCEDQLVKKGSIENQILKNLKEEKLEDLEMKNLNKKE